ncbi:hypothetical protein ACHQM5_013256 [Ranunculus cassubicifolius]
MAKQKVVIKVSMSDEKSRTRAMKIAVSANGVVSAELQGDSRNQIVVTGEGIDSTRLTMSIRKKVGFTELVSVTAIEEKKKEEKKDEKKDGVSPVIWTPYQYGTHQYTHSLFISLKLETPTKNSVLLCEELKINIGIFLIYGVTSLSL